MRRFLKLSLSVMLAGGALIGAAVAAPTVAGAQVVTPPGGAIVVGISSATCPSPSYSSIQSAIDDASSGATIYVCSGTYDESLTIDKPLTLLGAQYGVDARTRSGDPETIIDGSGGIDYTSGATTGTVSGFTLNGYTGGVGEIDAANVGSAWTFTDNAIDVSNGGIYFNTDDVVDPGATTIADNEFTQSTGSEAASGDYGQAVLIWQKAADDVTINDNDFDDLSGPGAEINTTGSSCATTSKDLTISDNSSEANGAYYDENLVALFCTTDASITGNTFTVTDAGDSAAEGPIYLGGGNYTTLISGNTLIGDGATDPGGAISLGTPFYANDEDVTVTDNTISGWGDSGAFDGQGIVVYGDTSNFVIEGNLLTDNTEGIWVTGAYGGTPSAGTVSGNEVPAGLGTDYVDSTTGSGTAGTNNTWTNNIGASSSPAGLSASQLAVVTSADLIPYPGTPSQGQFEVINNGDGTGAVSDVSNGPTASQGSLQMTTTGSGSHWSVFNEDHGSTALSAITALSYETETNDTGGSLDPGLQLVIDPGNTTSGPDQGVTYSTLNFEPYLQTGGQTPNVWQTWNVLRGVVWGTHLGGAPISHPISWSTFLADYPNATILPAADGGGVGFNVGSGWAAITGNVGSFTFGTGGGTTTYTFDPSAPSTSTVTSANSPSIVLGSSDSDSATVTGNDVVGDPTGTVQFYECGPTPAAADCNSTSNPVGSPVTLTAGAGDTASAGSVSFTPTSTGYWCFAGVYSGDSNYAGSSDNTTDECFDVTAASSSTVTARTASTIVLGNGNTDMATVTGNTAGGSPTGTVQFYECGPTPSAADCTSTSNPVGSPVTLTAGAGDTSSAGSVPFAPTSTGYWCFAGVYSGNSNYAGSSDSSLGECFDVTAAGSSTAPAPTAPTIVLGNTNTDRATITGNAAGGSPTGTVQFYECGPTASEADCTSLTHTVGTPVSLVPGADDTSAATSVAFTPTSTGYWCFAEYYSGDSNYSASSDTSTGECFDVTPARPDAPTGLIPEAGNGTVTFIWTAPASNGGSTITGYTVTASPGGRTCTWTSGPLTCAVTGLTNGTSYTFTVTATNSAGTGAASGPATATPVAAPGAPTGLTLAAGNGAVNVSWTAPSSNGGSPITGYTVTSYPGGRTCTWTSGPLDCSVTGLTNGDSYSFWVAATNAVGTGQMSTYATTKLASVPGAPTGLTAVAGNGRVTVSWAAPVSNGGSPITGYTVTASSGGKTCTTAALSCTVTGLVNDTSYTFAVAATNSQGTGPSSTSSTARIPTAPVTISLFANRSAALTSSMKSQIRVLASLIKTDGFTHLSIVGYANLPASLGINRASAVAGYLETSLLNIRVTRVAYTESYGGYVQPANAPANRMVVVSFTR